MSQRLDKIFALLFYGQTIEAEDLLEICNLDMNELSSCQVQVGRRLAKLRIRIEKMYKLSSVVKTMPSITAEEKADFISNLNLDIKKDTMEEIFSNVG